MATNSALATAGTETADVSLAVGTNPDAVTPASTTAAPVQNAQPNQAPLVVRIGANDVPVDQAQAYIDQQLTQIQEERTVNASAMQMFETFSLMTPQQQQSTLDHVESLVDGAQPARPRALSVSPIDIPAGEIPPAVKWEDMSDEARFGYATTLALRQEIRELAGLVTGMQQYLGQIHSEAQDEKTARALRLQGVTVDAAGIAEMRANGIADPIKAIAFLKGRNVAKPAAVATAPPEAPVTGQDNVFNDDDPNLSVEEMGRMMLKGMVPASQVAKSA